MCLIPIASKNHNSVWLILKLVPLLTNVSNNNISMFRKYRGSKYTHQENLHQELE